MIATQALRLLVLGLVASFALIRAAEAVETPALVADLDTGRVIYAEHATDPWYPASVTKLMTTYVALREVQAGRARMETLLTVSPEAARLPPSKMGFKPGSQIRLDNALKIIMVKSANDVAATIAENLGGSVEGFANLMNAEAQRLGMTQTHFVNPHGLFDEQHRSSARDMALLARALTLEFPAYTDLFSIGAVQFGKSIMRNHNGLIGRYPGATGMKTGYVCASGFNVVATASRNGRRLIAVVMGSPNAKVRTVKAASLFDYGFATSSWMGEKLENLAPSPSLVPTDMRAEICGKRPPAGEDSSDDAQVQASAPASDSSGLLTPSALAFASPQAGQGVLLPTPQLGPRSPVVPVPVWLGLEPPSFTEAAKEQEPVRRKTKRVVVKPDPKTKAAESKPKENPARVTVMEEPKSEAKPVAKPAAKAGAAKPAAKSTAAAKPVKAESRKPAQKGSEKATEGTKRSETAKPAAAKPQAKAEAKAGGARAEARN